MFSSPLNTRRNLSAVEISGMLHETDGIAVNGVVRSDTDLQTMNAVVDGKQAMNQQNSMDTTSVGSSSVDWSPPESNMHSRRNTLLGGGKQSLL